MHLDVVLDGKTDSLPRSKKPARRNEIDETVLLRGPSQMEAWQVSDPMGTLAQSTQEILRQR